ncbi:MAG: hypothetical protein JW818_11505 [Pirellulales bacterium]|nr:hypothetical protein [Pirellulales bacterium]
MAHTTQPKWFLLLALLAACLSAQAAEEKPLPWWEAETALSEDGRLDLTGKPWWKRAQGLRVGEHFTLSSDRPGGGRMIVRRERLTSRKGKTIEAIVWVLDDDGDKTVGDTDSDCYVVDYGSDGRVDRMVDYIDNDADGKANEMEIRYFHRGQLRIAWFGVDLDKDGRLWDLAAYEYSGNFFRSDPDGDNLVFANRYDPERREWLPISECPFTFHDIDADGHSEAVVRVSAAPLDFDPRKEPDPGNSLFKEKIRFQERFRRPGAVNVRYSLDVDGLAGPERPGSPARRLHYDLGFNLIGRVPYPKEGTAWANPLRRAPKTTRTLRHDATRPFAETYPAEQTGMSWREYGDDGVTLGDGPHADEDRRWEGVFWMWQRRFMHNTGGPTQLWNIRREFRPTPSTRRELYYCQADRRIHLVGATDGWIRVGHLGNPKSVWGEIRMFDTDRNGYFDRWETYREGQTRPVWIGTVAKPEVRKLPSDWDELQRFYTKELLPEALAANEKLMSAMRRVDNDYKVSADLAKTLKAATCDTEKRYVQDIIRHTQYLALRDKLLERSGPVLAAPVAELRKRPGPDGPTVAAWSMAEAAALLDTAYAAGHYDEAIKILRRIEGLMKTEP